MALLELSCVNCSAPLQIGADMERFACSYCGTSQIVQRSGGVVVLRKVEAAIHAVQRGTDRTAAELAIPRLTKELAEMQAARANGVLEAKQKMESARKGRRGLTTITFVTLFVLGVWGLSSLPPSINENVQRVISWVFLLLLAVVPALVFKTVKMPKDATRDVLAHHDALIAKVEAKIAANRAILDS